MGGKPVSGSVSDGPAPGHRRNLATVLGWTLPWKGMVRLVSAHLARSINVAFLDPLELRNAPQTQSCTRADTLLVITIRIMRILRIMMIMTTMIMKGKTKTKTKMMMVVMMLMLLMIMVMMMMISDPVASEARVHRT